MLDEEQAAFGRNYPDHGKLMCFEVSDRVGHSNVIVTQQIYTHRSVGRDRGAATAIAALIEEAIQRPK